MVADSVDSEREEAVKCLVKKLGEQRYEALKGSEYTHTIEHLSFYDSNLS